MEKIKQYLSAIEREKASFAERPKGRYTGLRYGKVIKTRKGVETGEIVKITSARVRVGINYDNMKSVKEGRESGALPAKNAGLPWGEWEIFPFVIKHKEKRYFRFSLDSGSRFNTSYFLNGKKVSKEYVQSVALASEFPKREGEFTVMNVSEENILKIV